MEMILFEVDRVYSDKQPYLDSLYKAVFAISYYGMMRIGEVTESLHVLKAKDTFIADNKDKLLFILYSSKTHDRAHRPQKIKISSNKDDKSARFYHRYFCPFKLIRTYFKYRGDYITDAEQFFIYRSGEPLKPRQITVILREMINRIGLDSTLYSMHSFRIGRTSDLINCGYPIEEVQRLGRWKSNAVYNYIRS